MHHSIQTIELHTLYREADQANTDQLLDVLGLLGQWKTLTNKDRESFQSNESSFFQDKPYFIHKQNICRIVKRFVRGC